MMNDKQIKSYYLSRETAQQVKDKADTHPYMNASNIVEQAIKEYLTKYEPNKDVEPPEYDEIG